MTSLPEDYLHRVYAGILGKLIGVYLGRPFENWTYQQILQKLGPIHYFVHEKFNLPCVVIDDDVSGTFAFFRALEEHGFSEDLSSEEVGKTWLNNIIEQKCVFWWGGNGISTEQTAFLNLKRGIKAPLSGSSKTNGRTVAEQIGSQIFIDAWAMLAPGKPALAANLARAAAMVSHDGEAVYAAQLWAAMEAEAFLSKDADHLLDTGLCFIPKDSEIASMISQIRRWVVEDGDWHLTRQRIEDVYGYDKYDGICHIMPNHGIMIMALLYAGDDFTRALHIINTSGWDTDCNSGNVGCLVAIMLGMAAFDGEPDWRGPIADRALISSADGGYSINDAARIAYDIVDIGYRLAGEAAIARPEAQFHFTLPGSVQGFTATGLGVLHVHQGVEDGRTGLCARIKGWMPGDSPIYISTPLFTPPEVLTVSRHYQMMACPLLYPGQRVRAQVSIRDWRSEFVPSVCLRIKAYDEHDHLITLESQPIELGHEDELAWTIPNCLDNKPIQQIGIAISGEGCLEGSVWLHNLRWEGMPRTTLQRPSAGPEELQGVEHVGNNSFWERSWVSSVDKFHSSMGPSFYLAQDRGEGMITQGTRDWRDYEAIAHGFVLNLGAPAGLAIRVRGLNRWYAVMFVRGESDEKNFVVLMKARDEQRIHLMSRPFQWKLDSRYEVRLRADGSRLTACVGDVVLEATDAEYEGGGVGLVLTAGSLSVERITIT